ncbi:hypothetical protein Bpfe_021849, partial [Biomphalaria pfeifferi]
YQNVLERVTLQNKKIKKAHAKLKEQEIQVETLKEEIESKYNEIKHETDTKISEVKEEAN